MFQTTDDVNIDEDFLNDVFDIPINNESIKRQSDEIKDQSIKKICKISSDKTLNILSIIQTPVEQAPDTVRSSEQKETFNQRNNYGKNKIIVQRKFPGPAGILPEKNVNVNNLEKFDISNIKNKTLRTDEIICSQTLEDVFKKNIWLQMTSDWSNKNCDLPNKYNISWTKSKATAKKLLGQKTPFLAAVIQTIDYSSKDPMILLKDKTGEIQATVLHEVWDKYGDNLKPGSVIVLTQTGVLSTLKKHYLVITLDNIIVIYNEVSDKIKVQNITISQIIETIEETKQNHRAHKALRTLDPINNNPYFKKTNQENIQYKYMSTHPSKFNFKSNTSTINTKTNANITEENVILTQMLDGLDADSLFEDF